MKKLFVTILAAAFVLQAGFALAVSTIHIGDNSGGYLWNNELVSVGGDAVGMQVASGNDMGYGYGDPVYLIIGIAGVTSTTLTIHDTTTNGAGTVTYGSLAYSLNANWGTAYSNTTMNAYEVLSLGSQSSQNWTNWTGAYADLMGTSAPASFGLFAFNLTNSGFDGSAMDITFNDDLATGTFVLGYAVFPGKTSGSNVFNTPFTETGFVQPVPEPSTLLLFGAGLIGLGFLRRRKN